MELVLSGDNHSNILIPEVIQDATSNVVEVVVFHLRRLRNLHRLPHRIPGIIRYIIPVGSRQVGDFTWG